jgi:hypothetical protein
MVRRTKQLLALRPISHGPEDMIQIKKHPPFQQHDTN